MSDNISRKKFLIPPRYPARWVLLTVAILLLTQWTVWASDNDLLPKFSALSNGQPAAARSGWQRPLVPLDVQVEPGPGTSKSSEQISSAVRLETPSPVSISIWPGLPGESVWPGWSPPDRDLSR